MIEYLTLRNFKSFRDTGLIEFKPITMLFGQNSSGKSTILQVLLILKQTLESPVSDEPLILNGSHVSLGEFKDIFSYSAGQKERIEIGIGIDLSKMNIENDDAINYLSLNNVTSISSLIAEIEIASPRTDEYRSLGNIPSLYRASIAAKRNGKLFGISFKLGKGLIKRLTNKYDLSDISQYINDQGLLFNVEKAEQLDFKPIAIIANKFLPGIAIKAYPKKLYSTQDMIFKSVFDLIFDYFQITKPKSNIVDRQGMWHSHLREIKRMQFPQKKRKNLTQDEEELINKILDLFIEIKSDIEMSEYEQTKMYRALSRIDYSIVLKIIDILTGGIEKVQAAKEEKRNLDFINLNDISFKHDELLDLSDIVDSMSNIFKKVYYLGPLREEPRAFYRRMGSSDPMYVGQKGENVAFVLKYYSKRRINTIIPSYDEKWDPMKSNIIQCTLGEAVEKWVKYIGIANEIKVEELGKIGLTILANIYGDKQSDLVNVGVGVSQVLPLIVLGLISPSNSILILEQPELHLHPYVQSKLADFFASLTRLGKQVIAETHSEHLVNRMRYHIARGYLNNKEDIAIYFAQRNPISKSSEINRVNVDSFGSVDKWPNGFCDETDKQLEEILMASLDRDDLYK